MQNMLNNFSTSYKRFPFIKRAVIIKIVFSVVFFIYWQLGKEKVFLELDNSLKEMKVVSEKNNEMVEKINEVEFINQNIRKVEFNIMDSGKFFLTKDYHAEFMTIVGYLASNSQLEINKIIPVPSGENETQLEKSIGYKQYQIFLKGNFKDAMSFLDKVLNDNKYFQLSHFNIKKLPDENSSIVGLSCDIGIYIFNQFNSD